MNFNFTINANDGGSDYGICTADSLDEARIMVAGYIEKGETFDVDFGIDDLINEQYGGIAFLSTDRGN